MMKKHIEDMIKAKKCDTCVHNAVCEKLEEFRDSLGWVSTDDEFVCSYYNAGYRKASDVAREIFEAIHGISIGCSVENDVMRLTFEKEPYVRVVLASEFDKLRKKYESGGGE